MDWFFLTMSLWLVLVFRPALSQVPNKDVRREYRLSSTSPLNSSHDVTTEMLRTYLELGTLLRSLLSCGFCSRSTEDVCSRTGEYVFDFAVVVLGVRVSILARPFRGAFASWASCVQCAHVPYYSVPVLSSGDARRFA